MNCDTIEELERYWQVQEQALGKFSPEIAITMAKLANLYLANGDFARALLLHQRALDIKLKTAGTHQSEIEESRRSIERIKEAREKSERVKVAKTAPFRSETAAENNGIKKMTGPAAIKELELEITLLKQMVGNEHPAVADNLTKLADLYCQDKIYTKMEQPLIEALRIRESMHGPEHTSVATELKNLGQLYVVQERYALAEQLFERSIGIRKKHFGHTHKKVLDTQALLIKIYNHTNRGPQAEDLARYLEETRKADELAPARAD